MAAYHKPNTIHVAYNESILFNNIEIKLLMEINCRIYNDADIDRMKSQEIWTFDILT